VAGRLLVTANPSHLPGDDPLVVRLVQHLWRRAAVGPTRQVELWQRGLEQHGYAERTIALKLAAVASFYRFCEQEDLIGRTPLAGMRRPRIERLSPRGALTRGQVHDLLANAAALGVHPCGLCCVLALNGLRIGEAASLNVGDLDYEGLFPVLRFTAKAAEPPPRCSPARPKPPSPPASATEARAR
jgi:site-specific recombinase XerD